MYRICFNGLTALSALAKARDAGQPFKGAILDMQMPSMSGEMLAQVIKADKTLSNTRLILMTSMAERGAAKRMQDLGFVASNSKADNVSCFSKIKPKRGLQNLTLALMASLIANTTQAEPKATVQNTAVSTAPSAPPNHPPDFIASVPNAVLPSQGWLLAQRLFPATSKKPVRHSRGTFLMCNNLPKYAGVILIKFWVVSLHPQYDAFASTPLRYDRAEVVGA